MDRRSHPDETPVRGLYEAHLPADDLDRAVAFYESLGLRVAYRNERVAFLWTEPERSWLGVWAPEPGAPEHHVAFEVSLADLRGSTDWLRERGIEPREVAGFVEPQVRPYQANASVYFEDPWGNNLEFICSLPVEPTPERGPDVSLAEWSAANPAAPDGPAEGGWDASAFVTGLNEAHLPVGDIEEAVEFYEGVLGLPVAWRDGETAFVWTEPGRSWLGLWEARLPEDHVAFEVSLDDLARSAEWLAERGVELREVAGFREPFVRPHQPIASAYFADSEDNGVEFMAVLPGEPADEPSKLPLSEWLAE